MKIITKGPEFTKRLNKVLDDNGISWEHFESDFCGNLIVAGIQFHMRVGLFLKQPQQAIMCWGQFVKFRPYRDDQMAVWAAKQLYPLNPKNPDRGLYPWPNYYWHPNGLNSFVKELYNV
jgi:hypothetical protein